MILLEFDNGDSWNVIEIEDAINFDPLESNEVVTAARLRDEMVPDILSYKIVFILFKGQLHLQAPFLFV